MSQCYVLSFQVSNLPNLVPIAAAFLVSKAIFEMLYLSHIMLALALLPCVSFSFSTVSFSGNAYLFMWLIQEPVELLSILYVQGRQDTGWKSGGNMVLIM